MTDIEIKRALISVTDKSEVVTLGQGLSKHGVEILSTGGTGKTLKEAGIPVVDVAEVTKFPEILDGRVKTLHPMIYGGLLGLRDKEAHRTEMQEHGIEPIDLIVVNLYAFAKKVAEPGVGVAEAMANVDIGGPCMIRAAAKNHASVAVLIDPADYEAFLAELDENGGALSEETRLKLARKAFAYTAAYDANINRYLGGIEPAEALPVRFTIPSGEGTVLRYGENPHQEAAFYAMENITEPCVAAAKLLGGKQLSYNNLLDTDAAFELVKEFKEPAAVIIKHTNPCGAAVRETILDAFLAAYEGDPLSAFGGIAALNRTVDEEVAGVIADPQRFLEVLIAPEITPEALKVLKKKVRWGKNLRILATGEITPECRDVRSHTYRSITGGVLVQTRDLGIEKETLKTVTKVEPDEETLKSLLFAWRVVKHVKSNAIVLAKGTRLMGVGAGQMSRIDSTRIAGEKVGDRARGTVMASDAFFPFRDCVDEAAVLGVKAIIQPGGSVRDSESIEAADEHGIAMVFTGNRHFRH
ncbi:MAG: bifunctional phosphoribosylaminoimidazolecarboxamide formyltransferase/IMP cyclohydrolase [Planctomycetota bacterium]|jgi:phosphoribosylaminoimidazolecarboxamide formyltransferase/IMP cyclohydrolase